MTQDSASAHDTTIPPEAQAVRDLSAAYAQMTHEIGKVIIGQKEVVEQLLLADEINRTPPKTQAALLEAMQEHHVTAGNKTYHLPEPFFVLATQNPIEQEGTYPLPEAQLDRFMFNVTVGYPNRADELEIM